MARRVQQETTRVEVIFYPHSDEAFLSPRRGEGQFNVDTRRQRGTVEFAQLASLSWNKTLGPTCGQFVMALKSKFDLTELLHEDDWVDIIVYRHDTPVHLTRGMLDPPAVIRDTSSSAGTRTYSITGRDFGKPFEITPIFFDSVADSDFAAAAYGRMVELQTDVFGNVAETVRRLLFWFLEVDASKSRTLITLPSFMPVNSVAREYSARVEIGSTPGVVVATPATTDWIDMIGYKSDNYSNDPARSGVIYPPMFNPGITTVAPLAAAWSDNPLCELFWDLHVDHEGKGRSGYGVATHDDPIAHPDDTIPTVVLRDRPWLTPSVVAVQTWITHPDIGDLGRSVIHEDDVKMRLVRGAERRNAFFASPQMYQGLVAMHRDMVRPLVSRDDIARHGMRMMDVTTNYVMTEADGGGNLLTNIRSYLKRVRDFHCVNSQLHSGSLSVDYARADIRVGHRLDLNGHDPERGWQFYVEAVNLNYTPVASSTTLGVSRGFRGADHELLNLTYDIIATYNDDELLQET